MLPSARQCPLRRPTSPPPGRARIWPAIPPATRRAASTSTTLLRASPTQAHLLRPTVLDGGTPTLPRRSQRPTTCRDLLQVGRLRRRILLPPAARVLPSRLTAQL